VAKSKNVLVWLGSGVFTRKGKIYNHGDVLPDDIDPKEIASLKKKKLIGNPVKAADISRNASLVEAQKKVIEGLKSEIAGYEEKFNGLLESMAEKDKIIADYEEKLKNGS
jgi:hypothetical protein